MIYSLIFFYLLSTLEVNDVFSTQNGIATSTTIYNKNSSKSYNLTQASIMACGTSILDNSDFESNFNSWDDLGNTSISSDAYAGNSAMLINGGAGGRSQRIAVNPGETYTLSFFAKKSGSEISYAEIAYKDVNDNNLDNVRRRVFENIYEFHSISMTAPHNAASMEIIGYKGPGTGSAYFDDFCLELVNDICANSSEVNNDGDGLCDKFDIDDDNDGIPDLVESNCNGVWQQLTSWDHNDPPNTGDPDNFYPAGIASVAVESYGSGIVPALNTTILRIDGVDQTDLTSAIADNDYVEYSFTTQNNMPTVYLYQFRISKTGGFPLEENFGYDFSILVSEDGFATSTVIADLFTLDTNVDPILTTLFQEADDNFFYLKSNTTYSFRCYFYNKTTDLSIEAIFDDFTIEAFVCDELLDTDGDGYPNSLDLDSDNDGITDLAESGHTAIDNNNDGIIDAALTSSGINGLYDGLESSPDRGFINYRVSDSEPSPDRIYDPYELDSDGDGCYDVKEESLTDIDEDGIVGTGIPSVDANGLVIGHTYGPTANNYWQDENLSSCVSISGHIFEDINYGGGDGRDYTESDNSAQSSGWTAGSINVSGVRVELYDSTGSFITATTSDASGMYTFSDVGVGDFSVRVVTESVSSNRASNSTSQRPLAVQTYRNTGTTAVTSEVGGAEPDKEDAGPNNSSAQLSTLYTANTTAHSVSEITVEGSNVIEVDFGYNFDTVVNTNSDGQGSLRQFILNSNELDNANLDQEDTPTAGVDFPKPADTEHSIFMIPGIGVHTIDPATALPTIRDTDTHITGYTQEGSSQGTIAGRRNTIELSANTTSFDGLTIRADNTTVSGLIINAFRTGITGSTAQENSFIWGNYIGSTSDGTAAMGNSSVGINLQRFTDSYIGTDGDNFNDENEGNLVVDNPQGIQIRNTSDVLIAGNIVGLDKTASYPIRNRFNGIYIRDAEGVNVVGFNGNLADGQADNYRNISSGNGNDGLRILNSDNQIVSNNYFGTNGDGTVAIGNTNFGIQIQGSSSNNIIGTDSDGDEDVNERNLLSGNGSGIRLQVAGTGTENLIMGNYIGTDITGNNPLGNVNHGLDINSFTHTRVGTNGDGIRDDIEINIISGNLEDGIRISSMANNTLVAGNHIGLGADGISNVGNAKRGIFITTGTSDATIGYDPSMVVSDPDVVGNKIHYNLDAAIGVSNNATQRNRISRNSMFLNGALGIDLDYDGVTTNDNGDGDIGSNTLINFPVFKSARWSESDSTLTVIGYAPMGSAVEIFLSDNGTSPSPLPGGYTASFGEGYVFFFEGVEGSADDLNTGTETYTNDGTGIIMNRTQNLFEFEIDTRGLNIELGTLITATATDVIDNTSEFSGVIEVASACCTLIMVNGYLRNVPNP